MSQAETFRQEISHKHTKSNGLPSDDVRDIAMVDGRVTVWTDGGAVAWDGEEWKTTDAKPPQRLMPSVTVIDSFGRTWNQDSLLTSIKDVKNQMWVASAAGLACQTREGWRFYEGRDGLPYNGFTCSAAGPAGEMWFGTDKGLIRFEDGQFAYRQGPRWLPDDAVRQIAVDEEGGVWAATSQGVGHIERCSMNLLEKALIYEREIDEYIKRTPYGYVSPVHLVHPGDRSHITRHDNDNDGLWTSMYGAGQCFAYAALKQPHYKTRAGQAFEALRFLQQVPQTGPIKPPMGYVARSIRSTSLSDPNVGRKERDAKMRAERDRLWKVYEPRWPKSGDGKWYWKGDTSSDELDGHYFFYGIYFDLVAETEEEREDVRKVVASLTDHLIDHGFTLTDHDGKPTRWARFDPATLNDDPNFQVERGLNSLSMLSYLAVAHHVTGDARYADVAKDLREKHSYHTNLGVPKVHLGFGSGNQSDDEMAFMGFYHLIHYTDDPALKALYTKAFHSYWLLEKAERNPFFHFAYAAVGKDVTFETPWRTLDLSPTGEWLTDSLSCLQGFPLDRVNWPHQNSHRLDLVKLPEIQSRGLDYPDQAFRGYCVDGKVLPVAERHFNHWNTDPWQVDYGGDGRTLACGTVYLLPFYMGLYHGFVSL